MTRRRTEEEEVIVSRAADVALLRLVEEAKRRGLTREALALIEQTRAAEQRQRTALGVTVTRRPR